MPLLNRSVLTRHQAMGMGFSIDIDPSPVLLVTSFNKLGADIRSFKEPLMRCIRNVITGSLQKNFDVMGRPDSWQEVSEQTHAQKSRLGYQAVASRPLHRTGLLKRKAGQINIWKVNGQEGIATLDLPSDVWYGAVHQEGSGSTFDALGGDAFGSNRGYVPQRLWALFQEEDMEEFEKIFADWLEERVQERLVIL